MVPGAAAKAMCSGRMPTVTLRSPTPFPASSSWALPPSTTVASPTLSWYAVLLLQLTVEEVHLGRADEAGHEQVGGLVGAPPGGADLLDEAVLHDDDAVAQGHGLGLVVGDVDEGGVDALAQR